MTDREAHSIEGLPDCDGEVTCYTVGHTYSRMVATVEHPNYQYKKFGPVTKITICTDLPGLHCSMERAKVFDESGLVFEAPVATLGGIHYMNS